MGMEIEVKVLDIDLDEIEKKLQDIGAVLLAKEYQINTIIDSKDNYINKELDSYLRIRETKNLINNETNIYLTLKKNVSCGKTRQNVEITTEIDNKESMISILKDLKYEVIEEGHKERRSYIYEGIRFDLDRWDQNTFPYPYMEIEVEKEEDLDKAIELLNINRDKISTKSIMELKEE